MKTLYDRDYYENGIVSRKSLYTNYQWMPDLTIPICCELKDNLRLTGKILDFGCAKGYMVKALRLLGLDAYGCDISDYAISQAPREISNYLTTTLPDSKFNWVLAKDVLEHIEHDELDDLIASFKCNNIFVAVPLGANGGYNVPSYDLDVTHVIREDLNWWVDKISICFDVVYADHTFGRLKNNYADYAQGNGFLIGSR